MGKSWANCITYKQTFQLTSDESAWTRKNATIFAGQYSQQLKLMLDPSLLIYFFFFFLWQHH